jgi:FkbM family methyltransferase
MHVPFTAFFEKQLPRVQIVDVGAMKTSAGEIYEPLLEQNLAEVCGFEPNQEEFERLQQESDARRVYLPHAVGTGSEGTLHVADSAPTSSLLPPNLDLVTRFQNLGELMQTRHTEELKTVRLDDLPEIRGCDFLKLDVQGSELDILKGAKRFLKTVNVIHTEVEFLPLYKDQPLFAEIDQFLRKQGFLFHRFASMQGRALKPFIKDGNINAPLSQHLWADAVYVRDWTRLKSISDEGLLRMCIVLHEIYRSYDLVHILIGELAERAASLRQEDYLAAITGQTVALA